MTVLLLIVNAVLFLATCLAYGYPPLFPHNGLWALNLSDGFSHLQVWQFLSYQFIHADVLHLLLNSWIIYTFGREVEEVAGRRVLLVLYLCGGLGGSLAQLGAAAVAPQYFGSVVVGASAAGLALLSAYAWLFPERRFTTLILFIIPVSVRARYLLIIASALALFGIAVPADNIAHAAHFGGILTGLAFARFALPDLDDEKQRATNRKQSVLPQATVTFITAKLSEATQKPRQTATSDIKSEECLQGRVDVILEKIHAQGIQSLTPQERVVLEEARQKMSRT
jgi:membrane associated rhomboid family serine protease